MVFPDLTDEANEKINKELRGIANECAKMARMTPEQFEDGEHRENEKQIAVHICRIVDAMQTGKKIGGGLNQSAARRPSISTRKTEIAT